MAALWDVGAGGGWLKMLYRLEECTPVGYQCRV